MCGVLYCVFVRLPGSFRRPGAPLPSFFEAKEAVLTFRLVGGDEEKVLIGLSWTSLFSPAENHGKAQAL